MGRGIDKKHGLIAISVKALIGAILLIFLFTSGCSSDFLDEIKDKIAQDEAEASDSLSDSKDISAFSFLAEENDALSEDVFANIIGTDIYLTVPDGTDVTALVATFTATGNSVTVDSITQTSGDTSNDFTNPVTYTVTAEDGSCQDYEVTVNPASTPPEIGCNPNSLSFTATEGGSDPSDQTLVIWNAGGQTVNWSVTGNYKYMTLTPTSGSSTGEPDNVTVSMGLSELSAGTYNYTITISDAAASNTPQYVPVTVTVNPPSTQPEIGCNPNSLSFTATEGGSNPSSQILSIWNAGGQTLNWSVTVDEKYLTLSPPSGSSTGEPDNLTVSMDISELSAGTYDYTITISAAGASNTPQYVPVTVTVIPPPEIACSPSSLSFTAIEGGSDPSDQTLGIWNAGGQTLNWSVTGNYKYMTLTPASGSSTGEPDDVTVSMGTSELSAGTYDYTITISAAGASNTPQTVPVTITVIGLPETPSSPQPSSGSTGQMIANVVLDWADSSGATSYDVYWGTSATPPLYASSVTSSNKSLSGEVLSYNQTYYWYIVAKNVAGNKTGPIWNFQTRADVRYPPDGAKNVPRLTELDWPAYLLATSYIVYFGVTNPPTMSQEFSEHRILNDGDLLPDSTTYYWYYEAWDKGKLFTSPIWSFATAK